MKPTQYHHETEINDHPYACELFPFNEGSTLLFELSEIAGQVGGSGLGGVLALRVESLKDVDFSSFGQALSSLPREILKHGGAELFARILKRTKRGTYVQDGSIQWTPLASSKIVDAVFAGEYLEAFEAVAWVLQCNFSPFLMGLWQKWGAHFTNWANVLQAASQKESGNVKLH